MSLSKPEIQTPSFQSTPLVVWRFVDGKAGHESQSQGLVEALARRTSIDFHDLNVCSMSYSALRWLIASFEEGQSLPPPDMLVGAGHRTHWPMLAARRVFGGKIVVLMKPSLPLCCFDHVIIPEHDGPSLKSNVILTKGALNTIRPSENASDDKGLILVGGPSRNHDWDGHAIANQVKKLLEIYSGVDWLLTTSRRTPVQSVDLLHAINHASLSIIPFEETEPGWVGKRLRECGKVWVSEDSVSMVFEALSSGAEVGLLEVPPRQKHSRVQRAVETLKSQRRLITIGGGCYGSETHHPLAEADRVAGILLKKMTS